MAVVAFDPDAFRLAFPQFATLTDDQLNFDFLLATGICNNSDGSIVPYCPPSDLTRQTILQLLTAHMAQLFGGTNGQPPSGLVGSVASAAEGSVSVGIKTEYSQNAAWFAQTQFGYTAWQMMARFRTARYRASPGRFYQPPAFAPVLTNGPFPWRR